MNTRLTGRLSAPARPRPALEVLEDRTVPSSIGALDPSFGAAGVTHIDFSAGGFTRDSQANGVALQADGRILLAGTTTSPAGDADFAVTRLNTDGSIDTTFGAGGLVRV